MSADNPGYREVIINGIRYQPVPCPMPRPGRFICEVPDLNDPKAPGVRSYGSDPAYIARLINIWSGFEVRWEDGV